jgi:hypothetical protein
VQVIGSRKGQQDSTSSEATQIHATKSILPHLPSTLGKQTLGTLIARPSLPSRRTVSTSRRTNGPPRLQHPAELNGTYALGVVLGREDELAADQTGHFPPEKDRARVDADRLVGADGEVLRRRAA